MTSAALQKVISWLIIIVVGIVVLNVGNIQQLPKLIGDFADAQTKNLDDGTGMFAGNGVKDRGNPAYIEQKIFVQEFYKDLQKQIDTQRTAKNKKATDIGGVTTDACIIKYAQPLIDSFVRDNDKTGDDGSLKFYIYNEFKGELSTTPQKSELHISYDLKQLRPANNLDTKLKGITRVAYVYDQDDLGSLANTEDHFLLSLIINKRGDISKVGELTVSEYTAEKFNTPFNTNDVEFGLQSHTGKFTHSIMLYSNGALDPRKESVHDDKHHDEDKKVWVDKGKDRKDMKGNQFISKKYALMVGETLFFLSGTNIDKMYESLLAKDLLDFCAEPTIVVPEGTVVESKESVYFNTVFDTLDAKVDASTSACYTDLDFLQSKDLIDGDITLTFDSPSINLKASFTVDEEKNTFKTLDGITEVVIYKPTLKSSLKTEEELAYFSYKDLQSYIDSNLAFDTVLASKNVVKGSISLYTTQSPVFSYTSNLQETYMGTCGHNGKYASTRPCEKQRTIASSSVTDIVPISIRVKSDSGDKFLLFHTLEGRDYISASSLLIPKCEVSTNE